MRAGGNGVALALLPAAFGALAVPLIYVILTQLGVGRRIATFGAAAILLDNALLAASRFILLDTFLIGFGLAAIACYLASRDRPTRSRIAFLAASALLAGCGLSIKWTGSSALAVILTAWLVGCIVSLGGLGARAPSDWIAPQLGRQFNAETGSQ